MPSSEIIRDGREGGSIVFGMKPKAGLFFLVLIPFAQAGAIPLFNGKDLES